MEFGGQRYQTTLGYSIKKADWDEMRRLVKSGTHNYSGQKANDINYYIKRTSLVVTGIEQQCFRNKTTFGKDRMKQAISEALSNDIASTEDIIERCFENIASKAKRYYKEGEIFRIQVNKNGKIAVVQGDDYDWVVTTSGYYVPARYKYNYV